MITAEHDRERQAERPRRQAGDRGRRRPRSRRCRSATWTPPRSSPRRTGRQRASVAGGAKPNSQSRDRRALHQQEERQERQRDERQHRAEHAAGDAEQRARGVGQPLGQLLQRLLDLLVGVGRREPAPGSPACSTSSSQYCGSWLTNSTIWSHTGPAVTITSRRPRRTARRTARATRGPGPSRAARARRPAGRARTRARRPGRSRAACRTRRPRGGRASAKPSTTTSVLNGMTIATRLGGGRSSGLMRPFLWRLGRAARRAHHRGGVGRCAPSSGLRRRCRRRSPETGQPSSILLPLRPSTYHSAPNWSRPWPLACPGLASPRSGRAGGRRRSPRGCRRRAWSC